ncbi:MAG: hypothetical protein HQ519_13955 [Planctomycetes bacterium]|nr:hypothetical protein [Planctomycetota bacterium]
MNDNLTSEEREILGQIDQAFAGVRLEDGISLNMTEYYDSGGCRPEYEVKAKDDEREDWSSIPDQTLEQFTVTFSFTDLKGFRFYVPAYMKWAIRNHRTSDSIIADFTIYAIDPAHYLFKETSFVDWFSDEQVAVMVRFLEFGIQSDGWLDGKVAKSNLKKIRKLKRKN